MIQKETQLNVADNTGAKKLKCIEVQGGYKKRFAQVGEVITCSVRDASPRGMVDKGEVVEAVIVRQKKEKKRNNGVYIRFDENAAVILEEENQPKGTRVFGPIARELRPAGFEDILSLAPEVL
ncbi:MAG: 50S ribosomal protein L14 [Parcubacteria group bacterium QH_9_35_7]|nr:MAG: 50S ribosomal protein L14 [Parcubacteria group bacterium QH_9_35_7]